MQEICIHTFEHTWRYIKLLTVGGNCNFLFISLVEVFYNENMSLV
jgi:hypothetical protein